MKKTDKIILWSLAAGAAIGAATAWIIPGGPWWGYALWGLLCGGGVYREWSTMAAREALIDARGRSGRRSDDG